MDYTKLYVGNLSYDMTEQELKEYFESIGEVINAKIIFDESTSNKRSKGFGFIEMSNEENAKQAIEKLNGTEFMGRNIIVSVARPRIKRD
ncbi:MULTISPECIES: RNA recognition motif domain-containing protein [Blattabacterium]|uniref:RNP-1 RNA-binding protein n=2 Tax=Blattabacterium punctulatus TaxID=164514 RepID=A0AAD1CMG5_9FLAO|nr:MULTISPECIES: RNA-binding protein [Blattabacterium]AEU09254.1 putative RNA-binding protein [Blattabacterium sp. (Cryptocercus punctulatus) str. Cpu]AWU39218.1 RNA-binding protein [Blattabacterium punctulatus]AWU39764.1 RNA-binding protein [Blattabacterium punctulatus]AWU40307.1 RNA-binding protein [Blattabacterium punctulatus]AWU42563.1 RNA-binding protein [Blattabacterium punctulatus]